MSKENMEEDKESQVSFTQKGGDLVRVHLVLGLGLLTFSQPLG